MRVTIRIQKLTDTSCRLSASNNSRVFEFKNPFQLTEFVRKTTERFGVDNLKAVGF